MRRRQGTGCLPSSWGSFIELTVHKDTFHGSFWPLFLTHASVQFNINVIAVVEVIIAGQYGSLASWEESALDAAIFGGSAVGMIVMGYLTDVLGRDSTFTLTSAFITCGALGSALAIGIGSTEHEKETFLLTWILICRCLLGIGLGGAFPVAGAHSFEDSSSVQGGQLKTQWSMTGQLVGQIFTYVLALALSYFSVGSSGLKLIPYTLQWRLFFLVGAVPSLISLTSFVLSRGKKSPDDHADGPDDAVEGAESQPFIEEPLFCDTAVDPSLRKLPPPPLAKLLVGSRKAPLSTLLFSSRKYMTRLVGASIVWCLFDIVAYGVTLDTINIMKSVFIGESYREDLLQNLVAVTVSIPGALLTIIHCTKYGVRHTQLEGCWAMMWTFTITGVAATLSAPNWLIFILFLFCKVTLWYGPGLTCFLMPNKLFPKEIRGTCNGISAAAGKFGAIIGVFLLPNLGLNLETIFLVCGFISVLEWFVTAWLIPDDADVELELDNAAAALDPESIPLLR